MANSWWFKCSVLSFLLLSAFIGVTLSEEPTFSQCKPHIEAAIKKGLTPDEIASETVIESVEAEDVTATISNEAALSADEAVASVESDDADEQLIETIEETPDDQLSDEQPEEPAAEAEPTVEEEAPIEEPVEIAEPEVELVEPEQSEEAAPVEEPVEEAAEPEAVAEAEPEPEAEAASEEPAVAEPEAVSEEPAVEEPVVEEVAAEEVVAEVPVVEEAPVAEVIAEAPAEAAAPAPEEPAVEAVVEAPVVEEPVVVEAPVEEVAVPEEPVVIVDDPAEGVIEDAPEVRRSRDHIARILGLNQEPEDSKYRANTALGVLKEVKRVVENDVRPLETIFKYTDISNRNFGDAEIFSKPLVLFLGPWSGGKSSLINYLVGTEYTSNALKTGAEPSATFFQILMHGEQEELLDGTQLAADATFSGLQKFGQAFIDRLRGKRLPSKILTKANIVEVPGILEVRKQVDRPYPFNDVVQWFIDRADIIFVVYDPTKLDTGIEHEALFDQLKGRQSQVRILLNKADSVTQEELLLIQNNLVWNLSPLMASALPPTLYAGSFWSRPYKPDAPVRLLEAHERNMLTDLREALDNVVENTIAEARRHAVRVRNHAKMVDCYLTTFNNHKSYFGSNKAVIDDIIENPHSYHIFEGMSTLNNISRYDLPDAEVYKDFFRLNSLNKFKSLASTCSFSFFRGCPLDKLDQAISYELPELVGKYKKRLQNLPKKGGKK